MGAALEKGTIAGYIAWEPFVSDAVVNGTGKVIATSADIWPNHPCCVVVVDRKFAEKNPDVVQRFLLAHGVATQWINNALARADSPEYKLLVDLGTKFTGRDAAVISTAFKNIDYQAGIDTSFQQSFVQFTEKLLELNVVAPDKLKERGYQSVDDFAAACIQPAFREESK
jgi:NitT/TauT family transport system substrate-binding protein